ncbi:MAG: ATP-binding protein [Isosphaeraceae bacterium]|nr:ATP-binding protein [Isosphaeraceae bacterium]
MSLATRLSAFFLLALALVLAGFSVSLYLLTRTYLVRQHEERLELALDTLEASVDIEPGGLEWEPRDRRITLGTEPGTDAVRWAVRDARGAMVDRSANSRPADFPAGWAPAAWPGEPDGTAFGRVPGWRLASRFLRLDELLRQGRGHPDDEPGYEVQYPALVLVVGLSPAPMEAALGRLRWTLALLSFGIWAAAATFGSWLSRRALAPVSRMARAAKDMTAADLGQRLPVPGTGDELDEVGHAFNDLLGRLHDAFARLHEGYERQRRFAGDASHQLRTPLAALLGQVQVALRRERPADEYRRTLELVRAEGERLRQIVESLLFLAHPERESALPAALDLTAWLPDHLERWSTHPRADDLHVEIDSRAPRAVQVHTPLLAQVLDNLWENACKYSVPGTPITVRLWQDEGSVAVGVEDRGHGLAAEDAARVFEPFFRTEQARLEGQPGVGLGLAVAQRIAATFGGSIEVRSQPGVGSHFILRLPRVPVAETRPAPAGARGAIHEEAIPA